MQYKELIVNNQETNELASIVYYMEMNFPQLVGSWGEKVRSLLEEEAEL